MAIDRTIEQLSAPTSSIRSLQLNEGNVRAQSLLGSRLAQSAGESTPSMKFGEILMNMLMKAQQGVRPGIESLQQRQSELQGIQSERIGETPESLIGASPELQRSVRNASASAVEPSISGTGSRIKTLSQQLEMANDILTQGRLMGQWIQEDKENELKRQDAKRKEKIELMTKAPAAYKMWFNSLDPKAQKEEAESMDVGIGYINALPDTEEKKAPQTMETDQGIFQWNGKTGQWEATGLRPKKAITETKPLAATEFNIKAGILGLSPDQVEDIVNISNPPQWFADKMKQEIGAPLLPGLLIDAWQKAKDKVKNASEDTIF